MASISTKCCANYACPEGRQGILMDTTHLHCHISTPLGTGAVGLRKGEKLKENK